jgi:cytochrome c-type biogenesis protein CcmH
MRIHSLLLSALIALAVTLPLSPAAAVQPGERLQDPALEARARRLSLELRCLVCQNQSIDDSDAALAGDLRRIVRERINAGDTDQQIRDFLVARYGEFVLLRPPLSIRTVLLWALPGAALLIGVGLAWTLFRRRGMSEATPPARPALSADEASELQRVLEWGRRK